MNPSSEITPSRSLFWSIIAASMVIRVFHAAILPLVTDEAYALTVGRSFSPSFFDHPPVGFWSPALVELFASEPSEVLLRLPNLIYGALTILGFYLAGHALGGVRAARWTGILVAITPITVIAGVMILPDSPLAAGLAFAFYALIRLAKGETDQLWLWGLGGAGLAFALASKYQAGFVGIGIILAILVTPALWSWLRAPGFWLAIGIAMLGLGPVLIWNLQTEWASFSFHSGRAGGGVDLQNFATMLAGQILYISPVLFYLCLCSLTKTQFWRDPATRLLLIIALVPIVTFNAIYLFSDGTLPHWPIPGWLTLLPLVGCILAQGLQRWLFGTIAAFQVVLVIVGLQYGLGIKPAWAPVLLQTDRANPWVRLTPAREVLSEHAMLDGAEVILVRNWIQGGVLGAVLGPSTPIRVLGQDRRHFTFMSGQEAVGPAVLLEINTAEKADKGLTEALERAKKLDQNALSLGIHNLPRPPRNGMVIYGVRLNMP